MSFTAWLRRQRRSNDRVGDLARDVVIDDNWPRGRTLTRLDAYLVEVPACDAARVSLRVAWDEYRAGAG